MSRLKQVFNLKNVLGKNHAFYSSWYTEILDIPSGMFHQIEMVHKGGSVSRSTTVKAHAKFQEKYEATSILPQDPYMQLCQVKGDAFGFAGVSAFDDRHLEIPFWEWLNYLEDTLCLDLKN